jgi:hypothetical protein
MSHFMKIIRPTMVLALADHAGSITESSTSRS